MFYDIVLNLAIYIHEKEISLKSSFQVCFDRRFREVKSGSDKISGHIEPRSQFKSVDLRYRFRSIPFYSTIDCAISYLRHTDHPWTLYDAYHLSLTLRHIVRSIVTSRYNTIINQVSFDFACYWSYVPVIRYHAA